MAEKVEISRTQLRKIAKRITEQQEKAYKTPDKEKSAIAWEILEADWFDYLKKELIGSDEED